MLDGPGQVVRLRIPVAALLPKHDIGALQRLFGFLEQPNLEPRYNIAPSSFVVALRAGGEETIEPALLKWGLVPSWAKDPAIGNRMINARSETVAQTPSFRDAFRQTLATSDSQHVFKGRWDWVPTIAP